MADNVAITAGSGTTIGADDVGGGVLHQRVKVTWGPDGTGNDADVASGKPMPVQLRGSDGTDRSNALPVSQSGTWTVQPGNTANTTPWLASVNDGTSTAKVRAGSSLPAASDTALVVTLRDTNANGQATMANSVSVALASNQSTIAVAQDTSLLTNGVSGTTLAPVISKIITASSSGATTIQALVSAKKIRVLSLWLTANGSVNVKFQSHTAGDITGLMYEVANSGIVLPHSPLGWFETTAGEALDINLSGAVAVGGGFTYVAV